MAGAADAQDLQVDAAGGANRFFVAPAMVHHALDREAAVRDVNVFGTDVDVVKKLPAHEMDIGMDRIGRHREILVEVEADDIGETQPFLPVQAHQLAVNARWRGAGGKTQHAHFARFIFLADQVGDLLGHRLRGFPGIGINDGRHALELGQDTVLITVGLRLQGIAPGRDFFSGNRRFYFFCFHVFSLPPSACGFFYISTYEIQCQPFPRWRAFACGHKAPSSAGLIFEICDNCGVACRQI
jgi:hypothetical protein